MSRGIDPSELWGLVDELWERSALPSLEQSLSIPAKSPHFDPEWEANGHLRRIAEHACGWAAGCEIPGITAEVGLDVIRDIEQQYFNDSGSERDRPPALLDRLIAAGRLGVKSGRGFYRYPNPEFEAEGWLTNEPPWSEDRAVTLEV